MILSTEFTVKYLLESIEAMSNLEPYDAYYYMVSFWDEINTNPILGEQLETITAHGGDQIQERVDFLFNNTQSLRPQWESIVWAERLAFSLLVVRQLATLSPEGAQINAFFSESMTKGINHPTNVEKLTLGKNRFVQYYFKPFIMACINRIERQGSVNLILAKYKQYSEWFDNRDLVQAFKDHKNTNIEVKVLQPHLYAFLYKEGVDFTLSPSLGIDPKGMPDFVASMDVTSGVPFIGEVKYINENATFGKITSIIKDGNAQLCRYLDQKLMNNGYLIIFNCSRSTVRMKNQEETVNGCIFKYTYSDGKVCRVVIIDIIPTSPSKIHKYRTKIPLEIDMKALL
jgi:hypothetical protein